MWLLIRCAHCGHNARLKVHHRVNVSALDPVRLRSYLDNDPALVADALLDPLTARRNHYTLNWSEAWELICPAARPLDASQMRVDVAFDVPSPLRPVGLIAQGLHLSRGQVERMIAARRITSTIDLRRRTSSSFAFTVRPGSS